MHEQCQKHPQGERRPYVVRGVTMPDMTYCGSCYDEWCVSQLPQIIRALKDACRVSQGC